MSSRNERRSKLSRRSGVGGALLVAALFTAAVAQAQTESCREWRGEHRIWKTETLRRSLRGAPQVEVDAAVFEVLQREAYLTSCETSIEGGRDALIGWRLVDRISDEYGIAVTESVLERAGFTLDLRVLFVPEPPRVATSKRPRLRGSYGSVRSR